MGLEGDCRVTGKGRMQEGVNRVTDAVHRIGWMMLGRVTDLSVLWFPRLQNGGNDSTYLVGSMSCSYKVPAFPSLSLGWHWLIRQASGAGLIDGGRGAMEMITGPAVQNSGSRCISAIHLLNTRALVS